MKTKFCRGCESQKPVAEFNKNKAKKDGLQTQCRSCNNAASAAHYRAKPDAYRERVKRRRKRNQEIIREAKDAPCADCGRTFPYYVMDFDHVRGVKKFNIGSAEAKTVTERVLREEIAKCEVICSNDHRIRTWTRKYG